MESMRLKNKTAVITGTSRGIGKAIALQFASKGCNIIINFRSDEQAAKDVGAQIREKGVAALLIQADVTEREAVRKMFEDARNKLGKIDILVNNAGITKGPGK
jgi:3-oxoacyl-[acyl-carrier protein] reductase